MVGCVGAAEAQNRRCWARQPGHGVTVPQCLCRCGPAVSAACRGRAADGAGAPRCAPCAGRGSCWAALGAAVLVLQEGLAAPGQDLAPPALSFELGLKRFCRTFTRAFLLAVAGTVSWPVPSRGLQGDLCSLSGFPGSEPGRVWAADTALTKSLTRPISCNSGLHDLTPCADSYRLFMSFPSENKTNCTLCLLLFLVACLDRRCGACCPTPTPPQVWRCAETCWGGCD